MFNFYIFKFEIFYDITYMNIISKDGIVPRTTFNMLQAQYHYPKRPPHFSIKLYWIWF